MKTSPWILPLMAVAALSSLVRGEGPVSHAGSFSKEGLFKADVLKLKDTEFVAHPDLPLARDKNVIWCGTLQLAWNKAIGLVGEKLQFVNQPPVVNLLNQEDFTEADLDPACYVALADFERNNVEDEIRAALKKKFSGAASPELIPPKPPHPGPDDFVAYAYLYKNLAFPTPFLDNKPLGFGSQLTKNFGFRDDKDHLTYEIIRQVSIYDYQSPSDFIIKLKTKSPDDELILAMVTPGKTLEATISTVLGRMDKAEPEMANKKLDVLAVPKLNFDLQGDFPELEGLRLITGPGAHVKNLLTTSVKQLIRFQLNEKGAILKSEAAIAMAGAALMPKPPEPHIMIFDKPFLILMKQKSSNVPYFAIWVGNSTLLMPADKATPQP